MLGTWLTEFYTPYTFVLAVAIPLTTMSYCYVKMFLALSESKMRFHSSTKGSSSSSEHKIRLAQSNIFQTCLIMTVLFLVSWLSAKSAQLLYSIGIYESLSGNHYTLGNLAIVANSCVNPYIYVLRYEDFQHQLRELVKQTRNGTCMQSTVTKTSHVIRV